MNNLKKLNTHELVGLLVVLAIILFASTGVIDIVNKLNEQKNKKPEIVVSEFNPFNRIRLEARSAYVFDVNSQKEIFSKNPDDVRPLASITKLMTALVVHENLPKQELLTILPEYLNEEGDNGLYIQEKWKAKDLTDFSLLVSSNDATRALASAPLFKDRESFIEKMNNKSKELGLVSLRFKNESGLDIDEFESGSYGSARDVSKLLEYIIINNPEIVEATRYNLLDFKSISNLDHRATNTNAIINDIPDVIASKTGYTDLAGGNLTVAFNFGLNRPIVVTVLGSSFGGRFDDVEKLIETTITYLQKQI